MELYLKNKQMRDIVDLSKNSKGDVAKESIELDIEGFKSALSQVDSQMKNLPATAQVLCQLSYIMPRLVTFCKTSPFCLLMCPFLLPFQVAAQQGAYLASCFNRMEECEQNPEGPLRFRGSGRHRFHPFRYMFNSLISHIQTGYMLDG